MTNSANLAVLTRIKSQTANFDTPSNARLVGKRQADGKIELYYKTSSRGLKEFVTGKKAALGRQQLKDFLVAHLEETTNNVTEHEQDAVDFAKKVDPDTEEACVEFERLKASVENSRDALIRAQKSLTSRLLKKPRVWL